MIKSQFFHVQTHKSPESFLNQRRRLMKLRRCLTKLRTPFN